MPRLPATAWVNSFEFLRWAFAGCAIAMTNAMAQTSTPPVPLKLERQLDENRAAVRDNAPTYARAQRIEGSVDERLTLRGDAEIRRGGTVVRGETITYTQATDTVNVEGDARVFRDGAVFTGPRLDFRVEAQTGTMPNADFSYAPRRGRGEASLIEFLGEQRALHHVPARRQLVVGAGRVDRVRWSRRNSHRQLCHALLQGLSYSRVSDSQLSDQ